MAIQNINIGTLPNDGTGDPLRTAFEKINQMFEELYNKSVFSEDVDHVVVLTQDDYDNLSEKDDRTMYVIVEPTTTTTTTIEPTTTTSTTTELVTTTTTTTS